MHATELIAVVGSRADGFCLVVPPGPDRPELWSVHRDSVAATLDWLGERERRQPQLRLLWWSREVASALVAEGLVIRRAWDLQEAHRLLVGGLAAAAESVWAVATGLDPDRAPTAPTADLFGLLPDLDPAQPLLADGYLNPALLAPGALADPRVQQAWGELAHRAAAGQRDLLTQRGPRSLVAAYRESGIAVLCAELERTGLPVDRPRMQALITAAAGPEAGSDDPASPARRERDTAVLRLVPGRERTDLRQPAQVLQMLHGVGVNVPDTRAGSLEPHRTVHPVVPALLAWRQNERIATTYGWSWLARFVADDDRLRGVWGACDGAGGRMTATGGLHNLPAVLRPAIAAGAERVLIRADLGQVEPRVLAVVSGDTAFAQASRADDLYADVARELGISRAQAKIAVLAAMYGQTSGSAAAALHRLEGAYPVAMGYLQEAARAGHQGQAVYTFGGRRVNVPRITDGDQARAVGRFTRNAVIQGSSAELFKAWALTLRAALADADLGAVMVLMLHDELVLEVPHANSGAVREMVEQTLSTAATQWSHGAPVRFVLDVSVVHRWSEAKG